MSTFVENCLRLFEVNADYDTDLDTFSTIASLSTVEKAHLAKDLLPGLNNFYKDWVVKSRQKDSIDVKAYSLLVKSIQKTDNFSREDFICFLENADLYTLKFVILNPLFPIDLLINKSSFINHSEDLFLSSFQSAFNSAIRGRYTDVVFYARSIVPDSEAMSDKMVLKIVGVPFT